MKKVLIIGANGKIGRILTSRLSESGFPVVAMVRDRNGCSFHSSVEVVEADLEGDIHSAMQGCGTVVFTAGSGAKTGLDKTLLVDLWGASKAIDAAKQNLRAVPRERQHSECDQLITL